MSENKTKLQKLATEKNRRGMFILLADGKTIEDIAFLFDIEGEGGKEKALSILEAALLPEQFENLPPFDMETKTFSSEAFAATLVFLNLPIESDEFTDNDLEALTEKGIAKYWQILSAEKLPELESPIGNYFSFPLVLPVVFTEEQKKQLLE
jgi:hypothetical protein